MFRFFNFRLGSKTVLIFIDSQFGLSFDLRSGATQLTVLTGGDAHIQFRENVKKKIAFSLRPFLNFLSCSARDKATASELETENDYQGF